MDLIFSTHTVTPAYAAFL